MKFAGSLVEYHSVPAASRAQKREGRKKPGPPPAAPPAPPPLPLPSSILVRAASFRVLTLIAAFRFLSSRLLPCTTDIYPPFFMRALRLFVKRTRALQPGAAAVNASETLNSLGFASRCRATELGRAKKNVTGGS